MSGNRGASPGVEVSLGHSSVPRALPDSKGMTLAGGLLTFFANLVWDHARLSGV